MSYTALLTVAGKTKLAAFAVGGPAITLSHIAVGDANGVSYVPVETQTALTGEKYRAGLSSLGSASPGVITVEAIIPADTPDGAGRASHGFSIAELGVFDTTGALIAVMRMNGGFKPSPSSGQTEALTLFVKITIGNVDACTVLIDPQTSIHIGRLSRFGWIGIESDTTTIPPATPAFGDTYLIPAAATGAWLGHTGKLAHWSGGTWLLLVPHIGMVVQVNDRPFSDFARFLRQTSIGAWNALNATETNFGLTRFASALEARAGLLDNVSISPSTMSRYTGFPTNLLPFPEVLTPSGTIGFASRSNAAGGTVSVGAGWKLKLGYPFQNQPSMGSYNEYITSAFTSPSLAINSTYFLRGQIIGGILVLYVQGGTVTDNIPGGLLGTPNATFGGGFDSTPQDILFAYMTTGEEGSFPQILPLKNKAVLSFSGYRQSPTLGSYPKPTGSATVYNTGGDSALLYENGGIACKLKFTLNWARMPSAVIPSQGYVWPGTAGVVQTLAGSGYGLVALQSREAITLETSSAYHPTTMYSGASLSWTAWWFGYNLLASA